MSNGVWLSLLVGLAAAWGATALADLMMSPGWAILLGLGVAYATALLTAYAIDVFRGRRRLLTARVRRSYGGHVAAERPVTMASLPRVPGGPAQGVAEPTTPPPGPSGVSRPREEPTVDQIVAAAGLDGPRQLAVAVQKDIALTGCGPDNVRSAVQLVEDWRRTARDKLNP